MPPGRGCAGERAPKIASAARAHVPPEPQRCHSGPSIAPLGLPQKGGFDSGVQVRRYAHDWNLVEPSLKWLSAKFRALLAGLTAAPESRSVPGLSSPNDGSHHWSQTPLSRRIVALGTWTASYGSTGSAAAGGCGWAACRRSGIGRRTASSSSSRSSEQFPPRCRFRRYAELGSVRLLKDELEARRDRQQIVDERFGSPRRRQAVFTRRA